MLDNSRSSEPKGRAVASAGIRVCRKLSGHRPHNRSRGGSRVRAERAIESNARALARLVP